MVYLLTRLALSHPGHRLGSYLSFHWLSDVALAAAIVVAYVSNKSTAEAVAFLVLVLAALIITVTDFIFQIIPDRVILPLALFGLGLALLRPDISLQDGLIGGAVGLAGFYALAVIGLAALKKQALGGGDIKVAAALGLYLGWAGVLATVFIGAALALISVVVRRWVVGISWKEPVPFGPFLMYAGVLWYACGTFVLHGYLQLFGFNGPQYP